MCQSVNYRWSRSRGGRQSLYFRFIVRGLAPAPLFLFFPLSHKPLSSPLNHIVVPPTPIPRYSFPVPLDAVTPECLPSHTQANPSPPHLALALWYGRIRVSSLVWLAIGHAKGRTCQKETPRPYGSPDALAADFFLGRDGRMDKTGFRPFSSPRSIRFVAEHYGGL